MGNGSGRKRTEEDKRGIRETRNVLSYAPSLAGRDGVGLLHTTLCPKRGSYGREDGDEDVEDFSPGAVVECSHSVSWFCGLDIRLITQDVLF